MNEKLFLPKVYRENRWLFYLIIIYLALQGFVLYKGVKNTPFYLWGMYSRPAHVHETYEYPIIVADSNEVLYSSLKGWEREILTNAIKRYRSLQNNQFNDPLKTVVDKRFKYRVPDEYYRYSLRQLTNIPEIEQDFPLWHHRYLEQVLGRSVKRVAVFSGEYYYDPSGRLHEKDRHLLFRSSQ